MATDKIPIYDFNGLKKLLTSLGYYVPEAAGYRPLEIADVDINDINSNIEFRDDGIFVLDTEYNISRQVFLYKRKYHLTEHGKPRYHICKCDTIQSFINSGSFMAEYRRANTEIVKVIDTDDFDKEKDVTDLPLCKNCRRQFIGQIKGATSNEYVELLKQASEYDDVLKNHVDVDIFGYAKDWQKISRAYRELHNYTCEECGQKLESLADQFYLHVHHVNGNKADNRKVNLQCLCIRCHSKIDDRHQNNFLRGGNKIILDEYNRKYPLV